MSEKLRNIVESDYDYIIENVDAWWDGRPMADMLPRLFFKHFSSSSFVHIEEGLILGFIAGFISQSDSKLGYIHFVGVDPVYRGNGVAKRLYERFFDCCREYGLETVQCVTSPVNQDSIDYHHAMGFSAEAYKNDGEADFIENYDGPGEHRILFTKSII